MVLVPFLALDRGRLRTRFLEVALASIAMVMLLSCNVWGLFHAGALTLAATRSSAALSIFRYIRSGYSPVAWAGIANYDFLSPILTVLALLRAWWWSWSRHPDIEAVAAVAVTTTVLFHQTGYPQYHMIPFVVGSSWAIRHWDRVPGPSLPDPGDLGLFRMARWLRCLLQLRLRGEGLPLLVHRGTTGRTPDIPPRLGVPRRRGLVGGIRTEILRTRAMNGRPSRP